MGDLIIRKQMTRYVLVLLVILTTSCSSHKNTDILDDNVDCIITRSEKLELPNDYQISNIKITDKFKSFDEGLSILKVVTKQGYDYKQNMTLYSSSNSSRNFEIIDENGSIKSVINVLEISKILSVIDKGSIVGVCKTKNSLKETTEYYIKNDGNLVLSVALSSSGVKDFLQGEFNEELKLISYF